MTDRSHLLTSREMALFAARGFLRFDEIVPAAGSLRGFSEVYAGSLFESLRHVAIAGDLRTGLVDAQPSCLCGPWRVNLVSVLDRG